MATKKTEKTIMQYLNEIGAADTTNEFLIKEFEYNETLGQQLKAELKTDGIINAKGRLSQAFIGYKMYTNIKVMLLTKLAMTVQDRSKLKLREKADAKQLSFDEFMSEAS